MNQNYLFPLHSMDQMEVMLSKFACSAYSTTAGWQYNYVTEGQLKSEHAWHNHLTIKKKKKLQQLGNWKHKLQESGQLLSIAKHTHTHTHTHAHPDFQSYTYAYAHEKSMQHLCLKINLHQNSPNIFLKLMAVMTFKSSWNQIRTMTW